MTVHLDWFDDDHTILIYQLETNWNWDTFYPAFQRALELEQAAAHRVDVIIHMPPTFRLPPSAITNLLSIARKQPANVSLSVFVTSSTMVQSFYEVARRLSPTIAKDYRFADSLQAAHQHILDDRA